MKPYKIGKHSKLTSSIFVLLIIVAIPMSPPVYAQDWRIGEIVGLCKGTRIYEGPGYNYRYHTVVPENDWAVKIIGGPRNGDWWDTSRREADDPSGGTGWVKKSEAESCKSSAPPQPPADCSVQEPPPAIGKIIGLPLGMKIYHGPVTDLDTNWHTIVPEDNWAVKITGGPRYVVDREGREWEWWDTSRREACDPSGGTGWIPWRVRRLVPTSTPKSTVISEATSPPIYLTPTPMAASTSVPSQTLCGEFVDMVTDSRLTAYGYGGILPCGGQTPYLFDPKGAGPLPAGKFYRFYDPVIIPTGPLRMRGYPEPITNALIRWSQVEVIEACEACGVAKTPSAPLPFVYVDHTAAEGAVSGSFVDVTNWPLVIVRVHNEHQFWTKIAIIDNFAEQVTPVNIWARFGYIPGGAEARYAIDFGATHNTWVQFFINAARSEDARISASYFTLIQRLLAAIGASFDAPASVGVDFQIAELSKWEAVLNAAEQMPDCVEAGDSLAGLDFLKFADDLRKCLGEDAQLETIAAIAKIFGKNVTTKWLKDTIFTPLKLVELTRDLWDTVWAIGTGSYAGSVGFHSHVKPSSYYPPGIQPTPVGKTGSSQVSGTVNTDRLNVRSGPGTNYPVVDGLGRGASVSLLEVSPDHQWAHVRLANDREGWGYVPLLKPSGPLEEVPVAKETPAPPAPPPQPKRPTGEKLVLGNYFAWYDADGWDACNISAGDKPLQSYGSDDPQTIARHVQMAMDGGLDGFTLHWFAPGERTDRNFATLLAQSQGKNFRSTVVFSRHIWHGSPAPTQQNVIEAVRYLLDTYSSHPNFLHYQGKPVIFFTDVYRVPVENGQTPQQAWAAIRRQVDPDGQVWWIAEGLDPSYLTTFDGLYVYKITHADYPNDYVKASRWAGQVRAWEQRTGKPKLWIATLTPGWDDMRSGCKPDVRVPSKPHKRDREDGAFYRATFDAALRSNPDWLWIHSFNEWVEGTYIEPSVMYGDKYMQMTREFVQQFKR